MTLVWMTRRCGRAQRRGVPLAPNALVVAWRRLVAGFLRMEPDMVIVGEVREEEQVRAGVYERWAAVVVRD